MAGGAGLVDRHQERVAVAVQRDRHHGLRVAGRLALHPVLLTRPRVVGALASLERPGQRQSISAASAVNSKGAFWFETYQGALTGELFVQLLKHMMAERERAVHLVIDGLPAHKKACVKEYVASTGGKLTLHLLPGYAPDLNPDELVWSHAKRTGVARSPLRKGEKLKERVGAQLQAVADDPALVRSFFRHPSVAYISDL